MSAAGPSQGANYSPLGGSAAANAASVGVVINRAAGPSQGANCSPLGGSAAANAASVGVVNRAARPSQGANCTPSGGAGVVNRAAASGVPQTLGGLARTVLGLFKLRIGVMIMITALVGLAVAPGPSPGVAQVIVLALSVLASAAAAGAFNQYVEVDTDRLMARTRRRAFVTGALTHSPAWLVVIGLLLIAAVASAWIGLNAAAALYTFLGAFCYGVVYTLWLKRRSWLNIVVGGLAGSFAVLAGAAAVDPHIGALPLLLALVLFLWTPPHFWSLAIANQADYAAAGVPMLPVVVGTRRAAHVVLGNTVALVAASLLPAFFGAGPIYLIGAALGGAHFVHKAWGLARAPSRATAMATFVASLVQLSLVLAAATIDGLLR